MSSFEFVGRKRERQRVDERQSEKLEITTEQ
jgi:hypothetical protein